MAETVLGIDIGTSSSKAVMVRPDGEIVASAERAHELSTPRPGWFEQDADAVWLGDVGVLCRELLLEHPSPAAVCVSGMGPCVLASDSKGRPVRPAILYGIDSRATREIEELELRYGAEAIVARGGSRLSTQAVGPKLAWLSRNEPESWARVRRLFMPSSYAVFRLTGEYVLDHHSASQCDPLYELVTGTWAEDWATDLAPELELPRLAWPGEPVGLVNAAGEEATGIPKGTPLMAGTIDAWAEAFSVGVRQPGDLMVMYGSTMFLIQMTDRPVTHAKLWATRGVEPGTNSLAAGMATSGTITNWLRDLVGGTAFDKLIAEARELPPGARGLLMLPYFAGERSPLFDPHARGLIAGLTLSHRRGHLLRATYEGTAFGVRHNLEVLQEAVGDPRRLVAVGGGSQSDVWLQIVSDVTGYAQELPCETIGASYGDALLAAIGVGLVAADADWTQVARVIEPDARTASTYDELFGLFRQLYEQTAEICHALAELQTARP